VRKKGLKKVETDNIINSNYGEDVVNQLESILSDEFARSINKEIIAELMSQSRVEKMRSITQKVLDSKITT
jgi:hypothetical protein